jgi:hypothetical protein
LQQTANFAAGFGDYWTMGGTRAIRQAMGVDDVIDDCSGSYAWSGYVGLASSAPFIVKDAISIARGGWQMVNTWRTA